MLSIAFRYSRKWRFDFSAPKCVAMIWGEDKGNHTFYMGADTIPIVNEFTHVGTPMYNSTSGQGDMIKDRISEGYKRVFMIRGLGSKRVQMNPITFSKAHVACVISKMCYGLELADLNSRSLQRLDTFQFDVAKKVQGLPVTTCNVVPLATIRWYRISSEVNKRCMMLHWQMIRLPMESVYKQVLVNRLVDIFKCPDKNISGPTVKFVNVCKALGLLPKVMEAIRTGIVCSKNIWKKEVNQSLGLIENNEWQATMLMASRLTEFKNIMTTCRDGFYWWQVARWNNKLLPKVKTMLRYMVMNVEECTGMVCGCVDKVTITHILFLCNINDDARKLNWEQLKRKLPYAMCNELERMGAVEKVIFIYTCFGGKLNKEWMSVYEAIVIFCTGMIDGWYEMCKKDKI